MSMVELNCLIKFIFTPGYIAGIIIEKQSINKRPDIFLILRLTIYKVIRQGI